MNEFTETTITKACIDIIHTNALKRMRINQNAVFCGDMLYHLWKLYDHVINVVKKPICTLPWQSFDQTMCK